MQAFGEPSCGPFRSPAARTAKELLNVVRLRWEAIRLGMERVKVKNGLMIVHFVGEENSPFYKSEAFMDPVAAGYAAARPICAQTAQ